MDRSFGASSSSSSWASYRLVSMARSGVGLAGSGLSAMRASSASSAGVKRGVCAAGRSGWSPAAGGKASSSASIRAWAAARWAGVGSGSTSGGGIRVRCLDMLEAQAVQVDVHGRLSWIVLLNEDMFAVVSMGCSACGDQWRLCSNQWARLPVSCLRWRLAVRHHHWKFTRALQARRVLLLGVVRCGASLARAAPRQLVK